MNTLAWVFILCAALLARAVSRGRVLNIGEDLSDAFLAIASGQTDSLAEVLSRKGESNTPTGFNDAVDGLASIGPGLAGAIGQGAADLGEQFEETQKDINTNIAFWAVSLGSKAKGYGWNKTGPDYYDCSGLMYRACQKVGYKGPRFYTANVAMMKGFHKTVFEGPGQAKIGDIVLWPGHHMGVMTGVDQFYSARSKSSGISNAKISTFRKEPPVYYRYTGK